MRSEFNMTKIKLCGLSRIEDIEAANELLPEYIGFVFYKKSSRNVTPEAALELKGSLDPGIKVVGVFVDEDISFINDIVAANTIDIIQLHGHEDNDYINKLKSITKLPVIKAIQISDDNSFSDYQEVDADYFLLDSGMGTGNTFNWNLVKDKMDSLGKGIFLAGGLDPDNVSEAIDKLHPFAVDVSSGIETDKHKDIDKMRRFVSAARRNKND